MFVFDQSELGVTITFDAPDNADEEARLKRAYDTLLDKLNVPNTEARWSADHHHWFLYCQKGNISVTQLLDNELRLGLDF